LTVLRALSVILEKSVTGSSAGLPSFLSAKHSPATAAYDFRVGHVFAQTFSILRRHLLPFLLLYGVASLILNVPVTFTNQDSAIAEITVACGIALALYIVLNVLAGAAVVYAAIDDMRGRPVDMSKAWRAALRRFFPVLGVTAAVVVLAILGFALIVPAAMVITVLFVAVPVCLAEGLGPVHSMRRSAQLTKGFRWAIFGLWFTTLMTGLIMQSVLDGLTEPLGGTALSLAVQVAWDTVFGAFVAILTAVTYRDLRVAKEGIDTDQIATVFD
jgi:hypothetical protein